MKTNPELARKFDDSYRLAHMKGTEKIGASQVLSAIELPYRVHRDRGGRKNRLAEQMLEAARKKVAELNAELEAAYAAHESVRLAYLAATSEGSEQQ